MGSGCGSVGRALTVNCIEKTKLKKWRPGMAHLKREREWDRKSIKNPLKSVPSKHFILPLVVLNQKKSPSKVMFYF